METSIMAGLAIPKMGILSQLLFIGFSFYFMIPCRAGPVETYWQEAWADGDCSGEPPAAHFTAGAPTEGTRRSQKPTVTHPR